MQAGFNWFEIAQASILGVSALFAAVAALAARNAVQEESHQRRLSTLQAVGEALGRVGALIAAAEKGAGGLKDVPMAQAMLRAALAASILDLPQCQELAESQDPGTLAGAFESALDELGKTTGEIGASRRGWFRRR